MPIREKFNGKYQIIIIINHHNNNKNTADKFGIKEIYSSKLGGQGWYIDMGNPNNDPRTDPQTTLIRNNNSKDNNGWKVKDNETRYDLFTSSGYKPQLITT